MGEEEVFIEAVRASRDDDLPRLVYADWLDERGGPGDRERAEFIRVGCEVDRLGRATCTGPGVEFCDHCARMVALDRREAELLGPNELRWRHDACPALAAAEPDNVLAYRNGVTWERGFIAAVTCDAPTWLAHGDAILARHPLRRVVMTTAPEWGDLIRHATDHARPPPMVTDDWPLGRTTLAYLTHCWPGVEFELPQFVASGPVHGGGRWMTPADVRQLNAVPGDPDWEALLAAAVDRLTRPDAR